MFVSNHLNQLRQLERLNPAAYETAMEILQLAVYEAEAIITEAMQEELRKRSEVKPVDPSQALANVKQATSASGIGADIKGMLGQAYEPDTPVRKWTPEEREKAYQSALKNKPQRNGIGSLPTQWK